MMNSCFFVSQGDREFGPFTIAQIQQLLDEGKLDPKMALRNEIGACFIASTLPGIRLGKPMVNQTSNPSDGVRLVRNIAPPPLPTPRRSSRQQAASRATRYLVITATLALMMAGLVVMAVYLPRHETGIEKAAVANKPNDARDQPVNGAKHSVPNGRSISATSTPLPTSMNPTVGAGAKAVNHDSQGSAKVSVDKGPQTGFVANANISKVLAPVTSSKPNENKPAVVAPANRGDEKTRPVAKQGRIQVTDLIQALASAGYSGAYQFNLERYVRFGSAQAAAKVKDQFTRYEAEEAASRHGNRLATQTFVIHDQPIYLPPRNDFETKGLIIACRVDLVLEGDFDEGVGVSRANLADPWFLTKDHELMRCDLDSYAYVAKNGFLYYGLAPYSELILHMGFDLQLAKAVSQNRSHYTADVVLSDLRYEPKLSGPIYYSQQWLLDFDWNCDDLENKSAPGPGAQPVIGSAGGWTGIGPPGVFRPLVPVGQQAPKLVQGKLIAVYVKKDGKVIESFVQPNLPGELDIPPAIPTAPDKKSPVRSATAMTTGSKQKSSSPANSKK
jgi:hypothetical protein